MSSTAATPVATPAPSSDRSSLTQAALDAVSGAVRLGDRRAFDVNLSDPHSRFADLLFANLTTLPAAAVDLRAEPRTAELAGEQRSSGSGGWAQEVRVATRLDHDAGPSIYQIWLAVEPTVDSRVLLAGLVDDPGGPDADGPDPGGPDIGGRAPTRPLWLSQPIRLVTGPDVTVVAAGGRTDLSTWLRRAETAEAAARDRIAKADDRRWAAGLVVELPTTQEAFDATLGVQPGSYDQIAAVAWPQGPDPATAAVRVVVNPKPAASLDEDRLAVLITHEATHVLTRSATSPAPMWLVEGFADWVAFDSVSSASPPTRELVLDDVRAHGVPEEFPADADFRPGAADLNLTYGRAWLLCAFIADTWSDADLVRLYAAVDGGSTLSDALAETLGVDEQVTLRHWQTWLEREAGR